MATKRNLTRILIGNAIKFTLLVGLAVYVIYYSLNGYLFDNIQLLKPTKVDAKQVYTHFSLPHYTYSEKPITITPQKFNNEFLDTTPLLIYHRITTDPEILNNIEVKNESLAVTPDDFENQIKQLLGFGYKYIFTNDILTQIDKQKNEKTIVMTFDDGYEDIYTQVFPILKKYKVKAMVYLISGAVNDPGYMTGSQVRELIDSGLVKIGAHTVNHVPLDKLSVGMQRYEIAKSKFDLEWMFQVKVEDFAYPYGLYNDTTKLLLEESGFKTAVNSDYDPVKVESINDRYGWGRIPTESKMDFEKYGIGK